MTDISVVVASFSGDQALLRCLESLEPQCAAAEVIVATDRDPGGLPARFSSFRFVEAPRGAGVFRLRALGVGSASGRLVALTEDHCTVSPRWVEALLEAHRAGHPVVGGPVDNGLVARTFDWALYLCEYAAHMPPLPDGRADMLLAVNIAYARELLDRCRETWREAFYENEVQDALGGVVLRRVESAAVTSHLQLSLTAAMAHLFRGGRRYGGHRKGTATPLARLLLPVAALAVPGLLVWRVVRTVARRRPPLLPTILRGLPYIVALQLAWGAGETVGYLTSRKT
jgi:hypothetical protein